MEIFSLTDIILFKKKTKLIKNYLYHMVVCLKDRCPVYFPGRPLNRLDSEPGEASLFLRSKTGL